MKILPLFFNRKFIPKNLEKYYIKMKNNIIYNNKINLSKRFLQLFVYTFAD